MRVDLPVKPALLPFCRKLLAEGADPAELVHVYRGDTLCFVPAPLAAFAALATEERDTRSIRLVRYREKCPQGDEYAPVSGEAMGGEP
ncbi:hypothetical protein [Paracoccus sp. SCSIO 75233]|uniref:hypothetical protein n=1 Tax=Paracoccus sp. SCSIO 75233 TaxID=3017782 RepID=UPI0022F05FF4|nr:hypothetical protein [Paracoccus sp. SCSIO 75233]WBU52069.1 hypothetical protein PAF12_09470 [Paracoccus sp. SCSIO 75233]